MFFRILFDHLSRYDWLLMGSLFLLMILGLISLFSLSEVSSIPFLKKQIIWAGIGIFLLIAVSFLDFRIFKTQTIVVLLFYAATIALLGGVLLSNLTIRGIEAWIQFGNFFIQPVEVGKLAIIILLAKFFSKRHIEIYRIEHLFISGLYVALPVILVLIQPDLGSAIILVSIWAVMILFSGMRLRHFFSLILIAALLSIFAWGWLLESYQQERITAFINPYDDSKGAGYQMIQSMIAVGSGQLWGKGLGYGSQSHLNFLPEAETDFIFAAFAEEWGFIGTLILLILIFIVLWRIIKIGAFASDNFSRLYALGFAAFIFVQSFIHIGMNMGLLPVTGITLPFVSYGGSSLVTLLIGVGILQNIKIRTRPAVEF